MRRNCAVLSVFILAICCLHHVESRNIPEEIARLEPGLNGPHMLLLVPESLHREPTAEDDDDDFATSPIERSVPDQEPEEPVVHQREVQVPHVQLPIVVPFLEQPRPLSSESAVPQDKSVAPEPSSYEGSGSFPVNTDSAYLLVAPQNSESPAKPVEPVIVFMSNRPPTFKEEVATDIQAVPKTEAPVETVIKEDPVTLPAVRITTTTEGKILEKIETTTVPPSKADDSLSGKTSEEAASTLVQTVQSKESDVASESGSEQIENDEIASDSVKMESANKPVSDFDQGSKDDDSLSQETKASSEEKPSPVTEAMQETTTESPPAEVASPKIIVSDNGDNLEKSEEKEIEQKSLEAESKVDEVTLSTTEAVSSTTEASSTTDTDSSTTETEPSTTEPISSTSEASSSTTEEAPSTTEEVSSTTEIASSTSEVPLTTEIVSSTTEVPPSSTEVETQTGTAQSIGESTTTSIAEETTSESVTETTAQATTTAETQAEDGIPTETESSSSTTDETTADEATTEPITEEPLFLKPTEEPSLASHDIVNEASSTTSEPPSTPVTEEKIVPQYIPLLYSTEKPQPIDPSTLSDEDIKRLLSQLIASPTTTTTESPAQEVQTDAPAVDVSTTQSQTAPAISTGESDESEKETATESTSNIEPETLPSIPTTGQETLPPIPVTERGTPDEIFATTSTEASSTTSEAPVTQNSQEINGQPAPAYIPTDEPQNDATPPVTEAVTESTSPEVAVNEINMEKVTTRESIPEQSTTEYVQSLPTVTPEPLPDAPSGAPAGPPKYYSLPTEREKPSVFSTPSLRTRSGQLRGLVMKASNNVRVNAFLGIPYAQAPVGNLRFEKPQEVSRWTGVLEAKTLPKSCPQPSMEFNAYAHINISETSEDCLYLNIWSPFCDGSKKCNSRPVIVYIHGGGFAGGGANFPIFDGSELAARGDLVVVNFNYRLGALGFLYVPTNGLQPERGNMGLYDQHTALKWIKANIKSFGGDHNKITIVGQDAGAVSVGYHVLTPRSNNLFKRAVMQSGSPFSIILRNTRDQGETLFKSLASYTDCGVSHDNSSLRYEDTLNCLKKLPFQAIISATEKFNGRGSNSFFPVIGEEYIPMNPKDSLVLRRYTNVDLLVSTAKSEGSFFLNHFLSPFTNVADVEKVNPGEVLFYLRVFLSALLGGKPTASLNAFSQSTELLETIDKTSFLYNISSVIGDYPFVCASTEFATDYANLRHNAYHMQFDHRPWFLDHPTWFNATHGDDIMFTLGSVYKIKERSRFDERVADEMIAILTSFAAKGTPLTRGKLTWPRINQGGYYMNLASEFTELLRTPVADCQYWKKHYPEY